MGLCLYMPMPYAVPYLVPCVVPCVVANMTNIRYTVEELKLEQLKALQLCLNIWLTLPYKGEVREVLLLGPELIFWKFSNKRTWWTLSVKTAVLIKYNY